MNTLEIVQQLLAERERLDAAIAALQGLVHRSDGRRRRGRPPGSSSIQKPAKRRSMSPAARKRIAAAMKARWAAAKKSGKKKL